MQEQPSWLSVSTLSRLDSCRLCHFLLQCQRLGVYQGLRAVGKYAAADLSADCGGPKGGSIDGGREHGRVLVRVPGLEFDPAYMGAHGTE